MFRSCSKCGSKIKFTHGTKSLLGHLKKQHGIDLSEEAKRAQSAETEQAKKKNRFTVQPQIVGYLKQKSREEVVSELVAKDGATFALVAKSEFIQSSLVAQGHKACKSPNTVRKIVENYGGKKKSELKDVIVERLERGERPCATLDEWTGHGARRFAGVKIHFTDKIFCAGLVRIIGSLDSKATEALLEKKLNEFGLPMAKVVKVVTDGAAVMMKFGRECECDHAACQVHGLHLGVNDYLYQAKSQNNGSDANEDNSDEEGENTDCESEESDEESDGDISDASDSNSVGGDDDDEIESEIEDLEEKPEIAATLKKVRKVIKSFTLSPVRKTTLRTLVDRWV